MRNFTLSLMCLVYTTTYAQKVKIAPAIGPNATITNMSKASRDDTKAAAGNSGGKANFPPFFKFQAGALIDYALNESFGLQSGLLINYKGWNVKSSGTYSGVEVTISARQTFTYLELPLWATYRIGDNGLKLIGGPVVGAALGVKEKRKGAGNGRTETQTIKGAIGSDPEDDNARPIDLSISLGLAREIMIADRALELSLNVQPSITKWNPSSRLDSQRFGRHFVVGLRAAYFFPIH